MPETTRIYINGRFLSQEMTGVQRYAFEITRALLKSGIDVTLLIPANATVPEEFKNCVVVIHLSQKGYFWEQFILPKWLRNHNSPLLINFCNTAPLSYSNNIIAIHDLAFLHHPEWFNWKFRTVYNYMIPKLAKRARYILTPSETIKKELIHFLNISEQKIAVLYNGLSANFSTMNPSEISKNEQKPYFLAFGGGNPRKNVGRIVEAMSADIYKSHDLVVIGRAEGNFNSDDQIKGIDENWIVVKNDVDDKVLAELYHAAEALVYPSLYEGFGIPVLEALSMGCPAIISDIPVFHELFMGNAIFVNPNDKNKLAKEMKMVSKKRIEKPIIPAEYSYDVSAEKLAELIEKDI